MNYGSAALAREVAQVKQLVCNNVPLLSYWINQQGEVWKVIHKSQDGMVVISRKGITRSGPAGSLLLGGFRKI